MYKTTYMHIYTDPGMQILSMQNLATIQIDNTWHGQCHKSLKKERSNLVYEVTIQDNDGQIINYAYG